MVFASLSIHTKLEREEHTQKKKKKAQIKKNMKICILQILEIWLKNFNRTR